MTKTLLAQPSASQMHKIQCPNESRLIKIVKPPDFSGLKIDLLLSQISCPFAGLEINKTPVPELSSRLLNLDFIRNQTTTQPPGIGRKNPTGRFKFFSARSIFFFSVRIALFSLLTLS
jgi:hypothetical protein